MLLGLKASEYRFHILTGIFATVLAITTTLFRGVEHIGISDGDSYVDQARGMLNGLSYMYQNPELFQHGLGFAWTISLTFLVSHSNSLLLFKLILAIAHGISTFLVAKIGSQLGLRKKYWVAAAILFSVDPFILLAATDVQTESVTTLIVLFWATLYISPKAPGAYRNKMAILFVVSGAYTTLMRPNSLLPFILVSVILFLKWHKEGIRIAFLSFCVAIFLGIIGIFEIFITKMYKGFVFLSPVGGGNAEFMCRSEFIPQYLGYASPAQNSKINSIISESRGAALLLENPGLSIAQINQELANTGISTCFKNPLESIWIVILKAFALWRPFTVYGAYGPKVFFATMLLWLPLTIFALWYLLKKGHSKSNVDLRNYFIVMSTGYALSLLLTPTQIRHRVAFAEPFYWLFAVYFIHWFRYQKSKNTGKQSTPI